LAGPRRPTLRSISRNVPIILTQHYSPLDRVYQDAEYSLYHYPRVYFTRVEAYDRFIYYRPLGKSSQRHDSRHYFGHGVIGPSFADPHRSDHRFAPLVQAQKFPRLVGIRDAQGLFYETEGETAPQFQAAVRRLSETAYHRILAIGGVTAASIDRIPSTEAVSAFYAPSTASLPPRDPFRRIELIPPGAGYIPRQTELNVYESAALQERARADHQHVLALIAKHVHDRGGICAYNNNVDLFADFGNSTLLIEAKSVTDVRQAVDRMRYGLGQLADYGFRYKEDLRGARAVLAFGQAPDNQTSWIADVLEENGVGFVAKIGQGLVPLNDLGRQLPLFKT
jgi:hypothetical protein